MDDPPYKTNPEDATAIEPMGPVSYTLERLLDSVPYKWHCESECDADTRPQADERVIKTIHSPIGRLNWCVICDQLPRNCICKQRVEDYWGGQGNDIGNKLADFGMATVEPWCVDADSKRTTLVREVAKWAGLTNVSDDARWSKWLDSYKCRPSLYRTVHGAIVRVMTMNNGAIKADVYAKDDVELVRKVHASQAITKELSQ